MMEKMTELKENYDKELKQAGAELCQAHDKFY
jgi:hypothetical protein